MERHSRVPTGRFFTMSGIRLDLTGALNRSTEPLETDLSPRAVGKNRPNDENVLAGGDRHLRPTAGLVDAWRTVDLRLSAGPPPSIDR